MGIKKLDHETINEWFTYKAPSAAQIGKMEKIREDAKNLAHTILDECPPGPDQTASIRKLRECVMTANLGVMFSLEGE